jgi:hypothetical protein
MTESPQTTNRSFLVVEATQFDVFGIRVTAEELLQVRKSTARAYSLLEEKDEKWKDLGFCKRQIASLWDAIVDSMDRAIAENREEFDRRYLIVDEDNRRFLVTYGEVLLKDGSMAPLFAQLDRIETRKGSVWLGFRDRLTNTESNVRVLPQKILQRVRKDGKKIRNALSQYVEWVKSNRRPIITCTLASGVLLVSMVAMQHLQQSLSVAKMVIVAAINLVCLFLDAQGAFGEVLKTEEALARRFGIVA